jgi:hypothetical protein
MRPAACCVVMVCLAATCAAGAQGWMTGWNINADSSGRIMEMSYPNPRTELGIERLLQIDVNEMAVPTGGTVTFMDDVQRAMVPLEAMTYHAVLGGPQAAWSYWEAHGTLATLTANDPVPTAWLGRETRMTALEGAVVVGRLAAGEKSGEYALQVEGAPNPVPFTMSGVRQLQQMK